MILPFGAAVVSQSLNVFFFLLLLTKRGDDLRWAGMQGQSKSEKSKDDLHCCIYDFRSLIALQFDTTLDL